VLRTEINPNKVIYKKNSTQKGLINNTLKLLVKLPLMLKCILTANLYITQKRETG